MNAANRVRTLRTSIAMLGVKETVKAMLVRLGTYNPERDDSFDRKYGTDTAPIVKHDDLDIADERLRQAAGYYVACPVKVLRHIFRTLDIDYSAFDFVDVGCGKGRVLLLASGFPFRSVTGVEISRALATIAESNLRLWQQKGRQRTAVRILCMDAGLFPIGCANTVYYFYHPFNVDVLRPVLNNIVRCFRDTDKTVRIVYVWWDLPDLFPVFEQAGFRRMCHVRPINQRYQYAIFTI